MKAKKHESVMWALYVGDNGPLREIGRPCLYESREQARLSREQGERVVKVKVTVTPVK